MICLSLSSRKAGEEGKTHDEHALEEDPSEQIFFSSRERFLSSFFVEEVDDTEK